MANRSRAAVPAGGGNSLLQSPAAVDRLLIAACAVIWLAVLGVTVAAAVVLADLGGGSTPTGDEADTPWLLYTVIGVSALVIAGSIPLLLQARRGAATRPRKSTPVAPSLQKTTPTTEPATEKLQVFGGRGGAARSRAAAAILTASAPAGASVEVVDRIMLRCTVILMGAIGLGLVVVATATYLMGVESDTAAWVALGVAGVITCAMPLIPFRYLGRLRDVTDTLAGD